MNSIYGRRLAASSSSSSSFMSAELPTNDSFVFGANNSDMARQLYFRALAGDSSEQLNLTENTLDGIAQRALLWDSGFGFSSSNEPVQIFTDGSHSMDDLAISIDGYEDAKCVAINCRQPDGTISYSNSFCDGDQMLSSTRCLIEDFTEDIDIHTSIWATGGSSDIIPSPRVVKHEWDDPPTKRIFTVLAIHTQLALEPGWAVCPDDGGYGSVVIPCASTANISNVPGAKITPVKGSAWVSRWLVENYTTTATPATSSTPAPSADNASTPTTALGTPVVIGIIAVCICGADL